MKLAKEIMKLMEDEQPKKLSDAELKKFWKDMQEHVFKDSKEVKKNDMGLFLDGTEVDFGSIYFDENDNAPKELLSKPQNEIIGKLELKALSPKDLVSSVLNGFTLDRESSEEEDEQALQYLLKNLKGETVYFYGTTTSETKKQVGPDEDEKTGEIEFDFEGTTKIKNFKYNEKDEEIVITDHDIVKMSVDL